MTRQKIRHERPKFLEMQKPHGLLNSCPLLSTCTLYSHVSSAKRWKLEAKGDRRYLHLIVCNCSHTFFFGGGGGGGGADKRVNFSEV